MSLITMEGQPVQELRIKGKIKDGICRAAYKCKLENKLENPIEVSFTFPLPSGVCSTQFKVSFGDEKVVSHVMRDDSSRLEYDDALAQGDFAAMAQVNNENEIRIDVGTLAPSEKCSASLYFVIALDPFAKGYLLILPTSIRTHSSDIRVGMSPPSLKLMLEISDSRKIDSITTPFNDKTKIDQNSGMITCDNLSIFSPLYVKISHQADLIGRCIYQRYEEKTFLNVIATAPRAYRDHPSQFTVIFENGPTITSGQMSLIMRALEFFILSIPHGCKFNYCTYGMNSHNLFDSPMELTGSRHQEALSFLKQRNDDNTNDANLDFNQSHQKILSKVNTTEMESVVVVIASSFPSDASLLSGHSYFFLEPYSRGDMRHLARKHGACYLPIPDEAAIISTILNVIKYTASYELKDCKFVIDNEEFPLPPVIPGCPFTTYLITEKENIANVDFICGAYRILLPVFEAKLGIVHQLWAHEKTSLKQEINQDDIAQLEEEEFDLAKQILTPENSAVVSVSREDEVEGDLKHVDSRLTHIGIGWIVEKTAEKHHRFSDDDDAMPHPMPHPRPYPMPHPMPHPRPYPMPLIGNIHRQHRPLLVGIRREAQQILINDHINNNDNINNNTANNNNNNNNNIADNNDTVNDNNASKVEINTNNNNGNNTRKIASAPRRIFIGSMHAKKQAEKTEGGLDVIDAKNETVTKGANDELQPKVSSKKPFFLLRVLQIQNPEGSWTDERALTNSCGFPIPAESEGLKRELFMTAFIVACIQIKGAKDIEKWELVVEKALVYLANTDPNADWDSVISSIKNNLLQ